MGKKSGPAIQKNASSFERTRKFRKHLPTARRTTIRLGW
jgi:hypothetical protein